MADKQSQQQMLIGLFSIILATCEFQSK